MEIHTYSEEDFGYLVAFKDGKIALYQPEAGALCAQGATSEALEPFKLQQLRVTDDFHLRSPLIVWLELTRACNLRCRHCFTSGGSDPSAMTTSQVLRTLDQLKRKGVFCVVFSGGEPLLRRDLFELLDYAQEQGFVIALVTNGLLLTEAVMERLPRSSFRLTISLDNLHFGGSKSGDPAERLSLLQRRLLALKERGIPCNVSSTMTSENLDELEEIFKWLSLQGIPFRTIPFTPIGRGATCPELQLKPAHVRPAAELWNMELRNENQLRTEQGLTFSRLFDFALTLVYIGQACKGGRYIAYVGASGDVFPCTTCVGAGAFRAGNITETPFEEIWEESLKGFRRLTSWQNFDACKSCALSKPEYFCTNRCPPLALLYRGSAVACGATAYDRGSLVYRTKLIAKEQLEGHRS